MKATVSLRLCHRRPPPPVAERPVSSAVQSVAVNAAVAMSLSANGSSSLGAMETPAGRPLPAGLAPNAMPRLLAAVSASSRSQVGPPKRLVTESAALQAVHGARVVA